MPFSKDIIPSEERIQGNHIAEYAKKIKTNDALYKSRFSSNLGLGLNPEKYPSHFSEVKDRIVNDRVKRNQINLKATKSKSSKEKKEIQNEQS